MEDDNIIIIMACHWHWQQQQKQQHFLSNRSLLRGTFFTWFLHDSQVFVHDILERLNNNNNINTALLEMKINTNSQTMHSRVRMCLCVYAALRGNPFLLLGNFPLKYNWPCALIILLYIISPCQMTMTGVHGHGSMLEWMSERQRGQSQPESTCGNAQAHQRVIQFMCVCVCVMPSVCTHNHQPHTQTYTHTHKPVSHASLFLLINCFSWLLRSPERSQIFHFSLVAYSKRK